MLACPNINTAEWKDLVKNVGEREAFREYMKRNDGSIPPVIDVVPLDQLPFSKLEDSENMKTLTEDVAQDLMEFLEKKFPGVKGNVINDRSKKWRGMLVGGKTPTINLAYAEASDGFHEFSHPFLMALRNSNPDTFNNFYSDLKQTAEWDEIQRRATERVDRLYPELKGKANLDSYKEEVLATAIGYAAELKLADSRVKISSRLGRIIDNIFKWINTFFTDFLANRIKTSDISPNTSFGELIDMFVDTRTQILLDSNWDKASDNLRIADAMTGAITQNQELLTDQLANDISVELQGNEELDLDQYINNWLDKTFKLPKKDYKPRKTKPTELALNVAQSMISIATDKGYQVKGMDIKERKAIAAKAQVKDETIEKLAEVLTPVTLNYKFSNYLSNKKNVPISLNQPFVTIKQKEKVDESGNTYIENTPSLPISMAEAEAVLEFQSFIQDKFSDRKSMTSDDLNKEYLDWVSENYGINWTEATGHVGYGMDRLANTPYQHYTRVLFVDDYVNHNKHQFKINNTDITGNGLGWYASVVIESDRFDHEFQSDILPEVSDSYKKGEYFGGSGLQLIDKSKSTEVARLASSKLQKMLETSSDFLLARNPWLINQIEKLDQDYIDSREPETFEVNPTELDQMVELPFSKLDSYDPVRLEEAKKFLTSEVDVQIEQLKNTGSRMSGLYFTKGYTKMYNLFLGHKNDQQTALFNWIKTFEARPSTEESTDYLPFSKTEDTPSSVLITTKQEAGGPVNYYLTKESYTRFPESLKKIYDVNFEWANSNAPIKPGTPNGLAYYITSLAVEAVNSFLDKNGQIKKNYGKNKASIKRKRDANRISIDKAFKRYNFYKTRLKALEWRKTIYSRTDAIIKMAEYYKGQYNRFYKFYSDVYDSALPIAKEKVSDKKQDESLARYKKYNDLYYKWFDIIVPQSINSAKAEGRTHYYLPTAGAMNAIEGNNMAEKVYWTPMDTLESGQNADTEFDNMSSFVSQNTPESTEVVRRYLEREVLSGYTEETTVAEIVYDLQWTDFRNSPEYIQFLFANSKLPAKQNGPLYTALVKYARKNNIKLTFEKPSWSKKSLIKVDLTGYTIKPIDRFSKLDTPQADNPVANLTPEEKKQRVNNAVVTSLADALSQNLAVQYDIITPEEAREITQKTKTPWNGEPAFYYGGKVHFVEGNMTVERVFHEYSHPFVDAIFNSNTKLFNNVYADLMRTPEGEILSAAVAEAYAELEQNSPGFMKEVLVRAITHEAMVPSKSKGFTEFVRKLMFMIKQALRGIFGTPVKVEKLNANTSLSELASMLKSDRFNFDPNSFDNGDVQYVRTINEFTEALEGIENSEITKSISNYYKMINNQINRIRSNKNYKDARELLTDEETQSGILQGIKLTLEASAEIDKRLENLLDSMQIREKNVKSLVHSVLTMEQLTDKINVKIEELRKNIDNKENLTNIVYYDYLLKNWSAFIEDLNIRMFDAGLDPLSKFGQKLTGLKGRLDTTRRRIISGYSKGVVTILKESLDPLIRGIDDYYKNYISKLESKPNPDTRLIENTKMEWEKNKLTDERITDLLTNKAGDTNMFSYLAESYINSPDPIVGGFTVYVKNAFNKADAIIQNNLNDLTRDLEPLLERAGYSRTNFSGLMSKLVFRDNVTYTDTKTGELKTKEVVTFLNPFKNADSIISKFRYDIEKAKEAGDTVLADSLIKDQRKHLRDYFNQEYEKAYYEREALYDTIDADQGLKELAYKLAGIDIQTATADERASVAQFYDDVAKETYREKYLLLNTIKELEGTNFFDETLFEETLEQTTELWREYTRMASLTDSKGNPKVGRELLKAQIERKFRKANNKFYEWVPITGKGNKPSFEFALRAYEQSLIDSGVVEGSPEFEEKKQRWLDKNTTVAFTKEFYDERNVVLEKLRAVFATLPKNLRDNIDSTSEMEEMLDMVTGFRDEDGQIIGGDISEASKAKVKRLQQAIADKRDNMAGFSGLTKEEMEELGNLYQKIISKQKLTPEERYRLQELQDAQVLNGVDKATRAEINLLYKKLAELQSKEATDYYVDVVNEYLSAMGEPLVDNVSANDLGSPENYVRLFNKSPEFEKWFKENHIMREVYDKEEDAMINVYQRLFVWNRTRPNNPDHYVSTTLSNGEVIQGKPILSYFYRRVKDEHRTERIVGKTVDNKGNWLPLTLSQGAKDALYQNDAYEKLRREDPAAFDVLEKMKEYHLKFQEGNTKNKKLYLQVPRYGAMAIENVSKLGTIENLKKIGSNIRQIFFKRSDDYEDGFNFNPGQLAYLDMFESDTTNVPVTGMYDLKPEEISMNLLDSMSKYMMSSVHQQNLLEINPFAQAIIEAVDSHKNDQGDPTRRAKALKNIYDRDFKGVKLKGVLSANDAFTRTFQKLFGNISKLTGTALFGLEIPGAIKNALAAKVEYFIESSGGRFLSKRSLALGAGRAWKVMGIGLNDAKFGIEYYKTSNKSLDLQLVQIFDPAQDYMKKYASTSFGRSFMSDLASGSWLMSPRKFLQYQTTLEGFFGLLYHQKVPRTFNGQPSMIPYANAWEVKNGQIQLKEGIDPEWAPGGRMFNEVKNRSHQLTNNLEGTYAEFDQPEINRYFLMRQMMFMKKFFTSMSANHVAVRRPSAALGTISAGNYANLVYFITNVFRYGTGYLGNARPEEVAAFKKLAAQVGTIAAMYATLYFVFDYDDDDLKGSLEVMKKRSGDALSKSFKPGGWLINNAEVTLYRTMTEVDTWWHPVIATKTIAEIPFNSALWDRGVKTPVNVLFHTYGTIVGDDKAFYKKNVGPYPWQKKGGSKAVTDLAKMFGLTGSTLDPTTAMKNHETLARSMNIK